MPRPLRVFLPNVSAHVIQRGNNRANIFRESVDYEVFLGLLKRAAARFAVHVHAYVLMTNHIHLLATPDSPSSLPRAMQHLGVHYVHFFNRKYDRVGTLWNGRYRSIPVLDERYWLTCLRYIEQNPIRAGMAESPADYRWSSYSAHAHGNWPHWLASHSIYEGLGKNAETRQIAYRALCGAPLSNEELITTRQPLNTP